MLNHLQKDLENTEVKTLMKIKFISNNIADYFDLKTNHTFVLMQDD